MAHTIHNIGVASQIGAYSDALEVQPDSRWLLTSGTPGLTAAGVLPNDTSSQADLAWQHVVAMLERARMGVEDIVKLTQYLTRREDIAAYSSVRQRYLGNTKPTSMLLVVSELVRPDFLVEVEVIAAKA